MYPTKPLKNEADLIERCKRIEVWTYGQLAASLRVPIPATPVQRKGWAGQAIELALGSTAGSRAVPDFYELGIELKTLPVNHLGKPAESTFVTTISLLSIHKEVWSTSQCRTKLNRVLWIPIEGDPQIPFPTRRIGHGILWSPTMAEETVLQQDWSELTLLISTGRVAEINASLGQYLQVRPKAANGKSLCQALDEQGNKVQTLPRGFYLRASFTESLLNPRKRNEET